MRGLALLLLSAFATVAAAQSASPDLPDIGNPANAMLTPSEEYRIGAMIVRQLRDQNQIIEDPEVEEYIQDVGSRIAAQAQDGQARFHFFVVKDPGINAFALPGGFIGVNHGLLLQTNNESQLASVIAHEVAHVTQRHIARAINAQSKQSLTSAAAILAAILIGAVSGSGDAIQGGIAAAQGAAAQQQINFTRSNENEADRVGIGFLAGAGFDPREMPNFFEIMGRRYVLERTRLPEFLQSHPITSNRIAESRARAAQFDHPKRHDDSVGYQLIRERLRVIAAPKEADLRPYYAQRINGANPRLADLYGNALANMARNEPRKAVSILGPLGDEHEGSILIQVALGQAQTDADMTNDALGTFAHAMQLFPRNVPLTVRYAEALMKAEKPKQAHELLLDLFNNVPPTPAQIRLTALAASAAGDMGDAYFYMSEYHISSGELPLASQQLELALASPNLTPVQKERFQARLDEIREFLAEDRRAARARQTSDEGGSFR